MSHSTHPWRMPKKAVYPVYARIRPLAFLRGLTHTGPFEHQSVSYHCYCRYRSPSRIWSAADCRQIRKRLAIIQSAHVPVRSLADCCCTISQFHPVVSVWPAESIFGSGATLLHAEVCEVVCHSAVDTHRQHMACTGLSSSFGM